MKSIKIVHDIDARIEFLFLAEFFRLCGVYVGEYVSCEGCGGLSDGKNAEDDFEIEIFVEKKNSGTNNTTKVIRFSETEIPFCILPLDSQTDEEEENQRNVLIKILGQLKEKNIDFNLDTFEEIAKIYVKHRLMWHSANLQYYRMRTKTHEKEITAFHTAQKEIEAIYSSKEPERHIWYAMLYSSSRANSACYYAKYSFLYDIDSLAEKCRQLIEAYPDFSNAWVLLGLIYEHTPENGNQAVAAFTKALKTEKQYSYASNIYYFMGKRYEAYERTQGIAKDCYISAFKRKARYRNIYKLAIMENKQENFEEALAYLDRIIKDLKIKKDKEYLDPLEVEYYYKSNSLAGYICCVENDYYHKAIEYAKTALDIADNIEKQRYYQEFYGEQKNTYYELSKKRMNLNKVCQYLAVSNRELGNREESDIWWKRAVNELDNYEKNLI